MANHRAYWLVRPVDPNSGRLVIGDGSGKFLDYGSFAGGAFTQRFKFDDTGHLTATGGITVSAFITAGVVHNSASGAFSSSLVVAADIAANTITGAQLARGGTNQVFFSPSGSVDPGFTSTPTIATSLAIGTTSTSPAADALTLARAATSDGARIAWTQSVATAATWRLGMPTGDSTSATEVRWWYSTGALNESNDARVSIGATAGLSVFGPGGTTSPSLAIAPGSTDLRLRALNPTAAAGLTTRIMGHGSTGAAGGDVAIDAGDGSPTPGAVRLRIGTSSPATRLLVNPNGSLQASFYGAGLAHFDNSGNITSSPVSLTADVSGVLPIANGGTGLSTAPAAGVVVSSGIAYSSVTATDGRIPFWASNSLSSSSGLIFNSANGTLSLTNSNIGASVSAGTPVLELLNASGSGQTFLRATINGTVRGGVRFDFGGNVSHHLNGGNYDFFGSLDNTTAWMRLAGGKLRIGDITSPTQALEVVGNAKLTGLGGGGQGVVLADNTGLFSNLVGANSTVLTKNGSGTYAFSASPTLTGLTLTGLTPDGIVTCAAGVLGSEATITDAQHGTRGATAQHALVSVSAAGFAPTISGGSKVLVTVGPDVSATALWVSVLPASNLPTVSNATAGIIPQIPGANRVLLSNGGGTASTWATSLDASLVSGSFNPLSVATGATPSTPSSGATIWGVSTGSFQNGVAAVGPSGAVVTVVPHVTIDSGAFQSIRWVNVATHTLNPAGDTFELGFFSLTGLPVAVSSGDACDIEVTVRGKIVGGTQQEEGSVRIKASARFDGTNWTLRSGGTIWDVPSDTLDTRNSNGTPLISDTDILLDGAGRSTGTVVSIAITSPAYATAVTTYRFTVECTVTVY